MELDAVESWLNHFLIQIYIERNVCFRQLALNANVDQMVCIVAHDSDSIVQKTKFSFGGITIYIGGLLPNGVVCCSKPNSIFFLPESYKIVLLGLLFMQSHNWHWSKFSHFSLQTWT